ncbi:MAG: DIP1984 family protein [Nanoarchaeota archaeon]
MKLGEALSLLKKEQGSLSRLISLRRDNLYVEEGKKTNFNSKKLSEDIDKKIEDIRKLKIKIQKTNLSTKIKEENISLAEAIIKVNDFRSKISDLSNLFEREKSYLFREKETKEMIPQLEQQEIENKIEELKTEKVQLDNKIQVTNWTTELID